MSYFDKVKIQSGNSPLWTVQVDPQGSLKAAAPRQLVGGNFVGTTFDTNIRTATTTGTGAVSQSSGVLTISTGVTANSKVQISSNKKANFIYSTINAYLATQRFTNTGTANNVREFGAYDGSNGYLFRLSGTTFSVVHSNGGSETVINSGSFNQGTPGVTTGTWTVDTNAHKFEILYTVGGVQYSIDDVVIHLIRSTTSVTTGEITLPSWFRNENSGGSTTNVTHEIWAATIYRLGDIYNAPISKRVTGAVTQTLKYSAGLLNYIILGDPGVAGTITFYDNTAGSGTIILKLTTAGSGNQPITIPVELEFSIGLTVVTTGASQDIVVCYE